MLVVCGGFVGTASAAQPAVGLGTASAYAVLAGQTVTNTGPSVISGDVGLYPGTAVTGFPPGTVGNGTENVADAAALQAQDDLTTGYNSAAGRTPANVVSADLGGQSLVAGVYKASSSMGLTGTVTLNGQGNAGAVFIFQAGSTLTTASSSRVALIDGAQACNVFWQVGSSATLGSGSTFVGTILALTSATLNTTATVSGRVLARNGSVTLDDNTITVPTCTSSTTATTTAGGGGGGGSNSNAKTTGTPGNGLGSGNTPGGGLGGGIIPTGPPETGLGGASQSGANVLLVVLGGLALMGAAVAIGQAVRSRRVAAFRAGAGDDDLDG
jgi:hypothetical protein